MSTAGEKFLKSLKLREWAEIERRTGMGMSELTEDGAPAATLTACLLTIARKRKGPGFTFEEAEDLDLETAGAEFSKAVAELGYEDDPADADADFTESVPATK